ncbi:MAG: hypothetical protein Q4G28_07645 [Neisseria sp.]|nr:hypothetical protein [Neisseria sp.]
MKRLFTAVVVAAVLAGCSTTVPVNYVPSPSMRGEGAVSVGQFVYAPAQRGEVKPNQFQPSPGGALGSMYLSETVDELLKDALVKELIAAGFNPEDTSGLQITGTVDRFIYDWVGFVEMDMYMDVSYTVKKGDEVVYQGVKKTHKALPKAVGYDSVAVNSVLSDNISQLLRDLRSKKLI